MKRLAILVLVTVSFLQANAQEGSENLPFDLQRQAYIYGAAQKYNDAVVARMALYNILAYNPANTAIMDSLALSYVDQQKYASAVLVCRDVLSIKSDDLLATEIAAVSYEKLGLKDRALPHYEALYLDNQDMGTLYKVAFLQLDLKRYAEAITSADILINSSQSKTLELIFQKNEKENQQISMVAAAYRLRALIEQSKGNKEAAKSYFKKALGIAPDFEVVKQQLASLSEG